MGYWLDNFGLTMPRVDALSGSHHAGTLQLKNVAPYGLWISPQGGGKTGDGRRSGSKHLHEANALRRENFQHG